METIRNYLESMFAHLPNSPEVYKAKEELDQMMEDKYTELLQEGRSENEAVGIVISEFGNLDELAETLGIGNVVHAQDPLPGRQLSLGECKDYLRSRARTNFLRSIGVFLCILSPSSFLLASAAIEGTGMEENVPMAIAIGLFFLCIAIAVGLFVFSGVCMHSWTGVKEGAFHLDYATTQTIRAQRDAGHTHTLLMETIGIVLCVICFVPVAVIGALDPGTDVMPMIGSAILFLLVGIGVMLLINASGRKDAYQTLLRLNDTNTVSGQYAESDEKELYSNETVTKIMQVWSPTVLCIYLIWSFLTFDWHITWIIWPVAAIAKHWIRSIWGSEREAAA